MILFKKVSYKNFLAAGNTPITINLNESETTLIVGQNGAGKSTLIEAIVFALFNKSFRKVNKNQLINSINEKDCLVEVEFSIGSVEWKIRRGIKPGIFEIYKNGDLLDQASSASDQQKWFEQSVIKLNYKSFTQIVVLGSSTFVPFMQLPAASRREIIEDLLDIRIFSTMNVVLKERIKSTNEDLKSHESEIAFLKEKAEMQKDYIKGIEKSTKKTIEQKEVKIIQLMNEVSYIETEIEDVKNLVDEKNTELKKYSGLDKKIKQIEKEVTTHVNLISRKQKEQKFFKTTDKCPTCTQVLSEDLKQKQLDESDKVISESNSAIEKFKSNLDKANKLIDAQSSINKEITNLNMQMSSSLGEIRNRNQLIGDIKTEINDIKNDTYNLDGEREKLQLIASQGITTQKNITDLKSQKRNYDLVSNLLKDTGIKSMIIRKYLPVMNQLINKYLQDLDFYVNFTLDEEFNETIKSRHRDDFTYSSFSEGEKMRIDLALMFTWRAIAKMKNSANTNLLILDEVFDSSLDVAGTEDFLRIIRSVNKDTNIFVISHKGEILLDKFNRVMKFEKSKNFSKMSVS